MIATVWFPDHPRQLELADEYVETLLPYGYEWVHQGVRNRWVIPAGFVYDQGSVPGWARWFIRRHTLDRISPHHDRGYQLRGLLPVGEHVRWDATTAEWVDALTHPVTGERTPWSRLDLDRLFGRMAREDPKGPDARQRQAAFWAVRIGGRWTAKKYA